MKEIFGDESDDEKKNCLERDDDEDDRDARAYNRRL